MNLMRKPVVWNLAAASRVDGERRGASAGRVVIAVEQPLETLAAETTWSSCCC